MTQLFRTLCAAALAMLFLVPAAQAADEGDELDVNELLIGHTADGFYLDFKPLGLVELPRIFLVASEEGGWSLDVFASTASAVRNGNYVLVMEEDGDGSTGGEASAGYAGHGASGDTEKLIASQKHLYATLQAPPGARIVLDFSITRHYVWGLIGALLVLALFIPAAQRYKRGIGGAKAAPRGIFQNFVETMVVFIRDDIAKPNLGHKYPKFLPFLLTAFFFILTCNLLGLVPWAAAATSNIAVTGVLAVFTFVIGQIYASKDHWTHLFNPPGVPLPVKIILVPVEIMGLFTRHIALAIRLFANMTAGTLVILSLIGLIFIINVLFGATVGALTTVPSILLTLFISVVKLLVAFIQAYVFTMLSALFIGMAVAEHHHDEPGEGATPELAHDHGEVTPHPIMGDGAEAERRTRLPEPTAVN